MRKTGRPLETKLLKTKPVRGGIRPLILGVVLLGIAEPGLSQRITDTSNGTLTVTLPFGTLTAGTSNTPDSVSVSFRIRDNNAAGYNLQVTSATFMPTPSAGTDGGDTIDASDIGVGIVSVVPSPTFTGILPRNDVITPGFDYDPAAVTATNGLTPYGGLSGASAQATLQDLVSSPGIKILVGNQIHSTEGVGAQANNNYLLVTMRFALLRQYFTPATFSGVITLRMFDGP